MALTLRTAARIAAAAGVLGAIIGWTVWYVYPDLPSALLTRARYSNEGRLVDATQYRHNVPIVASTKRKWEVAEILPTDEISELQRLAAGTSSNIVIIDGNGRILAETYHATPNANAAMLTNSMSMAKTLVAMLVGVAIDNGQIRSVDEPIGEYLAELKSDPRGKITIKNLLQMESGLANQDAGFPLSHLQAMYFGDAPDRRALSVPAVNPPGTTFEYNSVNTQLLLLIVERTLGDEFEPLLARYIWEPLGLDDGFGWRATRTGDAKGFCCVFATARSWAVIGTLLLDTAGEATPPVMSRSWRRAMIAPTAAVPNYGYQIFLAKTRNSRVPYAAMVGSPQQLVLVFPTLGLTAVRVGQEHAGFSVDAFHEIVLRLATSLDRARPSIE